MNIHAFLILHTVCTHFNSLQGLKKIKNKVSVLSGQLLHIYIKLVKVQVTINEDALLSRIQHEHPSSSNNTKIKKCCMSLGLRRRSHVTTVENHCDWTAEPTAGIK